MTNRRSFFKSLVAAIVLSPLVCRLLKPIRLDAAPVDGRPHLELWEMESTWDGSLSESSKTLHYWSEAKEDDLIARLAPTIKGDICKTDTFHGHPNFDIMMTAIRERDKKLWREWEITNPKGEYTKFHAEMEAKGIFQCS